MGSPHESAAGRENFSKGVRELASWQASSSRQQHRREEGMGRVREPAAAGFLVSTPLMLLFARRLVEAGLKLRLVKPLKGSGHQKGRNITRPAMDAAKAEAEEEAEQLEEIQEDADPSKGGGGKNSRLLGVHFMAVDTGPRVLPSVWAHADVVAFTAKGDVSRGRVLPDSKEFRKLLSAFTDADFHSVFRMALLRPPVEPLPETAVA